MTTYKLRSILEAQGIEINNPDVLSLINDLFELNCILEKISAEEMKIRLERKIRLMKFCNE